MIQLNPRYEAIFKMNHIIHHPQISSILPMNVEADFIKEVLDAGLYKQTTRITSSILLQTSAFVLRTMVLLHTKKDYGTSLEDKNIYIISLAYGNQ